MKLPTFRSIGLSAVFTVLGSALILPGVLAQDVTSPTDRPAFGGRMQGPGIGGGRGGPRGGEAEDRIEKLDANADGKVSLEEFIAARLERIDIMFERRDSNSDGLIAEDEGRPQRPANAAGRGDRGARGGPRHIELDEAALLACVQQTIPDFELPERSDAGDIDDRFEAVDTSRDGKLSLAEVTAAVQNGAQARFDKLDTDADGFITQTEMEALQTSRENARNAVRACARELAAA